MIVHAAARPTRSTRSIGWVPFALVALANRTPMALGRKFDLHTMLRDEPFCNPTDELVADEVRSHVLGHASFTLSGHKGDALARSKVHAQGGRTGYCQDGEKTLVCIRE